MSTTFRRSSGAARGWAAAAHVPALAGLDEYELVAVATTREASARAAAGAFGARHAFAGAAALAGHPDVDLVVVSVKAPDHAPAVRAALDAGKHVLVEWPLTVTAGEAAELAAKAEAAGVRHAVVLQGYASPGARFVRDLVREGRIGDVEAVAFAGGGGPAVSWPADAAAKELGLLADLFTRDQDVSSEKTRRLLGWTPRHTSVVAAVTRAKHGL